MSTFDLYAAYYDLLYRDKQYGAEIDYLSAVLRGGIAPESRILELGCGTGGHALELVRRGAVVRGVDLSDGMVSRALERRTELPSEQRARLEFETGNVCSYRASGKFDSVISMFHVMCYITANADQDAAFATARAHLEPGGQFFFDFWYGPAVLSDRPAVRTKNVSDERIEVMRTSTPVMHVNENIVDVNFDVHVRSRLDGREQRVQECHRMRYLFLPEIRQRLTASGFEFVASHGWMSHEPLGEGTWLGCVLARAC